MLASRKARLFSGILSDRREPQALHLPQPDSIRCGYLQLTTAASPEIHHSMAASPSLVVPRLRAGRGRWAASHHVPTRQPLMPLSNILSIPDFWYLVVSLCVRVCIHARAGCEACLQLSLRLRPSLRMCSVGTVHVYLDAENKDAQSQAHMRVVFVSIIYQQGIPMRVLTHS